METIYTIPVNEAFDEKCGCPFCRLYEKLEANEVELILGASMMEPDIRIQTNEKGFCGKHFQKLYLAQKRLPLALMLESHLEKIKKDCATPRISLKEKSGQVAGAVASFTEKCYLCDRVEFHFGKMFETACILWDQDTEFRKKFAAQPYFCLPCYKRLLETAKFYIPKKKLPDFLDAAQEVEMKAISAAKDDISHFCKKFDYRYQNEPWGNARDAVERSIVLLSGEKVTSEDETEEKE